jgi:membrane dipeptidase
VRQALPLAIATLLACGGAEAPRPEPEPEPEPAVSQLDLPLPLAGEGRGEGATPPPDTVTEGASESESDPLSLLAIDTHADTTQRILDRGDDVTTRLPNGHVDFPRMREGGLSGLFFSIWVDPRRYPGEEGYTHAQALIAAVRALVDAHPDQAALCTTGAEVRAAHASQRIAVLMGIEGAHALGDAPVETLFARLDAAYALGVRYMTVTWTNDNVFAHSSSGAHRSRGLTDDGRALVAHMNALGMIVDVSHVSDQTFWDVLDVSRRPVLASHSATRALSDHPRNLTDRMIRALGEHHGAVCINYYAQFVDHAYGVARRALEDAHREEFDAITGRSWETSVARTALARSLAPDLHPPDVAALGAHFAHAVELAGPESVCLGSDFDGVGELPAGLDDAAHLPALFAELERRQLPLAPILGENVLRILDAQRP